MRKRFLLPEGVRLRELKVALFSLLLGDPIRFAATALNTHNRYRKFHHDPSLSWSDKLSSQANKIAYEMVQTFNKQNNKRFEVPDEESVGENVERFLGVAFDCDSTAAMKATDNWYQVYRRLSYNIFKGVICKLQSNVYITATLGTL